MKKKLISALAAISLMTTQALPLTDALPNALPMTAIEASAVTAPAKVTGVKATATSETTATLTWKKVSGAKGYRIYIYNTKTKKYTKVTTISKNTTVSYKLKGLKANTSYKYKVRAYAKSGGKTVWGTSSAAVTLKTPAYEPAKVTGVKATLLGDRGGQLTWKKVNNAKGYRIYLYNPSTKKYEKRTTISDGSTVCAFKGLTLGTEYKFKVRAYRKVDGVTYWGTSSAAVTLKTRDKSEVYTEELKMAGEAQFYDIAEYMKAATDPNKLSVVKKAYELENVKTLKATDKEYFICSQLVVTVNYNGKDVVNYIPYACKAVESKEGFPMVQTYVASKWLTAPQIFEPATEYNEKMFDQEFNFYELTSPLFNTP